MDQNKTECCFHTKHGKCSFTGKHLYNNQNYCGIHLRVIKSTDDCAICLCSMNSKTERIRLFCGHYFHTNCLSNVQRAECPLCRSNLVPLQAYEIFTKNVIKPIALQTFAMEKDVHGILFDCMRIANKIGERGQWHANILHQLMSLVEQNSDNTTRMSNVILSFQQALLM